MTSPFSACTCTRPPMFAAACIVLKIVSSSTCKHVLVGHEDLERVDAFAARSSSGSLRSFRRGRRRSSGGTRSRSTLCPPPSSCHVSSALCSESPLVCNAKSTIVVVPPIAAAAVPLAKSSAVTVPPNGMSRCVCGSMKPGKHVASARVDDRRPVASGSSLRDRRDRLVSIRMSAAIVSVAVTTVPPRYDGTDSRSLQRASTLGARCRRAPS